LKNASVIFALIVTLTLWFALTKLDAKVGEFTGEDYLHQCTSIDPNRNLKNDLEQAMAVYCVGYIDAAVTMIAHMERQSFCLPKGTTPQDILKATIAFLQTHPDQKQQLLASTMIAALQLPLIVRSQAESTACIRSPSGCGGEQFTAFHSRANASVSA